MELCLLCLREKWLDYHEMVMTFIAPRISLAPNKGNIDMVLGKTPKFYI
jgi:hypothetical protein